jgi:predicted lipoprotein with Yx(FWY)xxD motif
MLALFSAVALSACGGGGGGGTTTATQASATGGGAGTTTQQAQSGSGTSTTPATSTTSSSSAKSGASAKSSAPATLSVGTTSLGKVLVDSQGRTLYLFKADKGTHSACSGACAAAWPPLRVTGKPVGGKGITASKLGTTPRSDGKPQVTYNGHPLYTYVGDTKSGQVTGQALPQFGAPWYVVSPAGNQITTRP